MNRTRRAEILAGINITPEKRQKFLDRWQAAGTTPEPAPPIPADRTAPCAHRGEELDQVRCKPCQSRTGQTALVPKFACAKHGECVLEAIGKPIKNCRWCDDYDPLPEHAVKPLLTPDTPVSEVRRLIDGPPPNWPAGWHRWANVEAAQASALRDAVANAPADDPGGSQGRGIVICAGGSVYFVCAIVLLTVLRKVGCTLPIEIWYLGRKELDPRMRSMLEAFAGVRCVDLLDVADRLPEAQRPRIMGGWQSKIFAIRHSRFREVLFLDADQVPVGDPAALFDWPEYRETGAIFWPDLPNHLGTDITAQAFRTAGLPIPGNERMPKHDKPSDYRPFESGQMLIDKSRCGKALAVCQQINDHSDYWFREPGGRHEWLIYGDKSTFLLAWEATRTPYRMPPDCSWGGTQAGGAFLQKDFAGNVVLQHRCQPPTKWNLHGANRHPAGFHHAATVDETLTALRLVWNGKIYDPADATTREQYRMQEASGDYQIFRGRALVANVQLRPDGTLDGGKEWGDRWTIRDDGPGGEPYLYLCDFKRATALFGADKHLGWCNHRDNLFLMRAIPAWFQCRASANDTSLVGGVLQENEYRLPPRFESSDVIVDVGGHCGAFAVACLERGAGVVHTVEPVAENLQYLVANVSRWNERCVVWPVAAWSAHEPAAVREVHAASGADFFGGMSVIDAAGDLQGHCIAVPIDWILDRATHHGTRRIRLLKLDCEGGEWPILWTSERLHLVDEICGEYHEKANAGREEWNAAGLRTCLEEAGFDVEIARNVDLLGNFFARRRT